MKRSYGTLTGNTTITVSLNNDQDLQLLLTQGGAGSFTVTWVNVDTWLTPGASAPVLKTAVGASDLFTFSKSNGKVYGIHTAETGAAGAAGAAGITGITWRRTWSNANTYAVNDAVYWNGSSYIALLASSSTNVQQPDLAPTYWGALAAGGGSGSAEFIDNFTRADNADVTVGAPFGYTAVGGARTTVAAGSNGVHTNTFAGAGSLSVAATSGFASAGGAIRITHGTTVSVVSYTGVSGGNTFTGCSLVNGVDITMATSDPVVIDAANIVSNQCRDVNTSDQDVAYRAEQVLVSSDHHCQVTIGTITTSAALDVNCGPICRMDTDVSLRNGYVALVFPSAGPVWKVGIWKVVAGVMTSLGNGSALAAAPIAGDTIKLTVAGTTITAYYNSVQQVQLTDASVTTGVRCGFQMARVSSAVDIRLSELRFGA